jgi:catechol 2,3-dioxygenase-like lactoylglutathione lyase family enzyme
LNVNAANLGFYQELMAFLGWQTLYDGDGTLGVGPKDGHGSLWFVGEAKALANDYDGPGMNHLGISAPSQADVDATAAWLRGKGVAALFETPRHRPEFSASESETYYQVMFESPDRILFEVVYTGPKA